MVNNSICLLITRSLHHHKHQLRDFFNTHRWDEKAGLRRDAVGSQVINALEAQKIKETGNEEG